MHRTDLIALLTLILSSQTGAQVRVVTTTPTLADITRQVGGRHVEVESIMHGPENVHNVAPKPSFLVKLRRADLFVHGGLDAEPWVSQLVKGARRPHVLFGQPGNVDASLGIVLKEVPQRGELTRALGDIHVYGNTHYALDPMNGIIIARSITDALQRTDPVHRAEFDANCDAFASRIRELTDRLVRKMEPYRGMPVVTYHRTWPYFLDRFGPVKVAEIEPKPGLAPGPQHLNDVVKTMKATGATIVIVESFNSTKNAEFVANLVGGRAIVLAHEVNAVPDADSYETLFDYNVNALINAIEQLNITPPTTTAANEAASPVP